MIDFWKKLNDYAEICFGATLLVMWIATGLALSVNIAYAPIGFFLGLSVITFTFQMIMLVAMGQMKKKPVQTDAEWRKLVEESAERTNQRLKRP